MMWEEVIEEGGVKTLILFFSRTNTYYYKIDDYSLSTSVANKWIREEIFSFKPTLVKGISTCAG